MVDDGLQTAPDHQPVQVRPLVRQMAAEALDLQTPPSVSTLIDRRNKSQCMEAECREPVRGGQPLSGEVRSGARSCWFLLVDRIPHLRRRLMAELRAKQEAFNLAAHVSLRPWSSGVDRQRRCFVTG